ncbi:hypothetical protein [Streptosporangium sp. NBC_01756]|uniref:hypothetical protein n=1 Tax=Streptosporangium sp. NBC_01756 TaxID=2975950 RepID=UPI002DD8F0D2|nr:hypothetical protein [Streptosporangium sp. NBC_01756]WSC88630.1 hypothetical protein OIE48_10715 [Streptosporangium sp. NBC_01756]
MRSKRLTTIALAALVGCAGLTTLATTSASASAPGTATAADFSGYQIVKLPNANVPNFSRRTVRCPAGKKAVGGGAEAQGNGAILVGSFPTDDGAGWIGLGRQIGYNDVGISVYAICANVS